MEMNFPVSFYKRNRTIVDILILLLLNLILKGLYLTEADIGGDECFSVYYSQLPFSKIIAVLSRGNNPPLHEIILHFWIHLFGISEAAVRFPSYLFNCLTVIPLYFIGELFIKRGVGLIAVLLFTFSSYSLFVAHDARVYDLVLFLSCCSFFIFLNLYDKNRNYRLWLLLLLINVALIYAHYLAVWIIVVQGIAVLTHRQFRERMLTPFLLYGIALTLLFLPFLPIVYTRFLDSGINGTWVPKVKGPEAFYNMIWVFSNKPIVAVIFIVIIILAALVVLVKSKDKNLFSLPFFTILLWVWLPLIVSFVLSFRNGFFLDKYMLFTSPAYYLCVASASVYMGKQLLSKYQFILPLTCVALMVSTFSIHSIGAKYSGGKGRVKHVVEKINELNKSGTAVFVCPDWFDKDIVYYLDRNLFTSYFSECDSDVVFKAPLLSRNIYQVKDKNEVNLPMGYKTLVFVDNCSNFHLPENGILNKLNLQYTMKDSFHYDQNVIVYSFEAK